MSDKIAFQADVSKMLDIVINSLYSEKQIFLRELISNASDACDKLKYLALTQPDIAKASGAFKIVLKPDQKENTLTVSDNGIGMNKQDLIDHLGTIAKSGTADFVKNASDNGSICELIGQFGVGFYSAFMVADELTVISRSYKEDTAHIWKSEGASGYTIEETEKENVGTDIIMHLKADTDTENYSEYLSEYRLKNLIKTYSDYIRHPIKMEFTTKEPVEVPEGQALFGQIMGPIAEAAKQNAGEGGFEMNEGIMQMMGGFTVLRLIGMLGMTGLKMDKEQLLDLNAKLNQIKKA